MSSNAITRCLGSLAVVAALSFMVAACGDDATQATCSADQQCGTGKICVSSACVAQECGGNGDCLNGDQACIQVSGGSFCSAVECGCATCSPCGDGKTCNNGTCVGTTSCDPVSAPCSGSDICDAGTCRACAGAECPTSDCTVTPCTGGKVCNTTTKLCETPAQTAAECASCANDEGCPGAKCQPLATGNACLLSCDTNNDCETGFECGNHLCAPVEGRCEGCLVNGCGVGQACDPSNATCGQQVAACGSCTDDWQCGADAACHNGKCAERCDGTTCASGGSCVATNGIQVCANACQSACNPTCSGATPVCESGVCVQCNNNAQCQNGQQCNTSTHACEGTLSCSGSTPVEWQGTCVQCTSNTDCPGQACDITNHVCTAGTCGATVCAAPYPACVTIGNDHYCVQCDPSDTPEAVALLCGDGTCNDTTYACEGGHVEPPTKCTQDSDCVGGEAGGFDLVCDTRSGYCYDTGGFCDDITAYCPGTDGVVRPCVSFFEAFSGGGGGGIPSIPGADGGTIPGFCGCDYVGPSLTTCATGATCIDIAALFAALGGGTPTTSQPVCFNLFGN